MKQHRPSPSLPTDWTKKWLDLRKMREVKARPQRPPRTPRGRRLKRLSLLVLFLLVGTFGVQRWLHVQEQKLWNQCQTVITTRDLEKLNVLERFIRRYPRSPHVEEVLYYYASFAHPVQPCEALQPIWTRVLQSKNPEYAEEAAVRLGDCALSRGDLPQALEFYRGAFQGNTRWAVDALLKAGRIAETQSNVVQARRFYHDALTRAQTNAQIVEAATRLGTLNLTALARERRRLHRVQNGENASVVARRYGITLKALLAQNRWLKNPSQLYVGDVLLLPPSGLGLTASLENFALYLTHRERIIRYYPMAVGAIDTPTPVGTYFVKSIGDRRALRLGGNRSRSGIAFDLTGHGIEGGANLQTLRTATTSGTLQLLDSDVEELSRLLSVGVPVRILRRSPPIPWAFLP